MAAAIQPEAQARWTLDDERGLGTLIAPIHWDPADRSAVYAELERLGWSVVEADDLFRPSPDHPVWLRLLTRNSGPGGSAAAA